MHLAEFLSGPNKRRDRRRLLAKNATRTTDASFLRDPSPFLYSHFSLLYLFSLPHGTKSSGPCRAPAPPTTSTTTIVAPVNRQKLLSIPRMYSILLPSRTPFFGRLSFSLSLSLSLSPSVSPRPPLYGRTLLRIRYVNRKDDNQTETDCPLSTGPSLSLIFFHSRFRPFHAVPVRPRARYAFCLRAANDTPARSLLRLARRVRCAIDSRCICESRPLASLLCAPARLHTYT